MRLPLPQFATDSTNPHRIAEVIETTTTEFLAQCIEPEELDYPRMPPFGSFVKSLDEESGNKIIGIVTYVTTSPIDSVHRVRALGLSLSELRQQQPQIFAMLKTEFCTTIVGFESFENSNNGKEPQKGTFSQYIPPRPPQIHQAVYSCKPEEIIRFSDKLDFLRILLQTKTTPPEALTAAVIRRIYHLRKNDRDWLIQAGRTLSILLKNDYDCLKYILSQIHL